MNRQTGQVLIESLVALSVVAVALPIIVGGLIQTRRVQETSMNYYTAVMLLEQKVNTCRLSGKVCAGSGDFTAPFRGFHYRINARSYRFVDAGLTLPALRFTVFWKKAGRAGQITAVMLEEPGGPKGFHAD